jgi:hypothetical protein
MIEAISKTLIYVSICATILPVIVGFIVLKHLKSYLFPILFVAVIGSITEATVYFLVKSGKDPWIVNMIYTLAEFSFLVGFYYLFYKPHLGKAKIILLLIPLFYSFCAFTFVIAELKLYGTYSISIESLIISLFALSSYIFILKQMPFKNILSESFFYINTGFLFYFLGNLAFFALSSHIKKMDPANYVNLRIIHSVLNISLNLLISVGFWKAKVVWE